MTDVQMFPNKVYITIPDADESDYEMVTERNIAVSYDTAADLWVRLDAVRLASEGMERHSVMPGMLEHGDRLFGFRVHTTFTDSGITTVHFEEPFGELLRVHANRLLEIERPIQ